MPGVFIVIVIIVIAIVAYFEWQRRKARTAALADLARGLGWRFEPSDDRDHDDEYVYFDIFRKGRSRVAYNTLYGSVEIGGSDFGVKMGDFRYTVQHGKHSSTYRLSYLILHMPFHSPDLLIRREGVFDKLVGALGFADIDFESEEFSRRFHVKSSDKKFAYDVVHPRMMEWLMAKKAPAIDIEHGRCCIATDRQVWEPDEFKRWLRRADEFFELWPDYLMKQLHGQ